MPELPAQIHQLCRQNFLHRAGKDQPTLDFVLHVGGLRLQVSADCGLAAPESWRMATILICSPGAGLRPLRGDSLQLYLREISQVKLLTAQEEITLAKRIQRGDRQAREHMIKANLRLVVKIARAYDSLGLPLLDLINEGNIGLMKGVRRFDPKMGTKLSTYASWWIKQAIKRALANHSKTIRLPVHVTDRLLQIRRAEAKLHDSLEREPTDDEIAAHLGLGERRVRQYREAARPPSPLWIGSSKPPTGRWSAKFWPP